MKLNVLLLWFFFKEFKLQKINEKQQKKVEAKKANVRKKKVDPMSEIEGNQKLNKLNKLQFKKQKKQHSRRGNLSLISLSLLVFFLIF